ncbi:hypothetical protein LPUS_11660 [Lasallia pustulata]|uniref:Uncharacterized protein n=1 Tax=Lasallia pustulata TaxID=136370 RepID=A0A1W5DCV6_9LECA|nr:hypothetical protein LPUS_11660 [Lasallia pustulata]
MAPAPVASQPASTPEEDQQGFFPPWFIRQPEASNSDTSPAVSPMSAVTQHNIRKGDTGRLQHSLLEQAGAAYEAVATTLITHSLPVSAASAGNTASLYAVTSSETSPSPQADCTNGSFGGSYAEKSPRRPPLRGIRYSSRDGSSSRATRPSSSPNMEITEHLSERVVQGTKPAGQHDARLWEKPPSASDILQTIRPTSSSENSSGSDFLPLHAYRDDLRVSDALRCRGEKSEPRVQVMKLEKEGLYRRTKRYLGLRRREFSSSDPDISDSRQQGTETDDMLEGVSRTLKGHQEQVSQVLDLRSDSNGLPIARKTPQHQQSLSSSYEMGFVSDSSFSRNDDMTKPPLNTPDSDAVYRGPDDQEYFKIELSAQDTPTFLPSEARRIRTPPLSPRRTKAGKIRGFFSDLDAVREGEDQHSRNAGDGQSKVAPADAYKDADTDINWFRVSVGFETVQDEFQLDVPDHLPNSPLCPLHPKNKSGGTGICVYHGRSLSSSV